MKNVDIRNEEVIGEFISDFSYLENVKPEIGCLIDQYYLNLIYV